MKRRFFASILVLAFCVSLLPNKAFALTRTDFQASTIFLSYPPELRPGETSKLYVSFKNIGIAPWLDSGQYYVSVYSYDTARRIEADSIFATSGWVTKEQAQKLPVSRVNPGEQVQFEFPIRAPSAPGTYKADFVLVAETISRMSGGKFSIQIDVKGASSSPSVSTPAPAPQPSAPSSGESLQGLLMLRSARTVEVAGNESQEVIFGFKNTGSQKWSEHFMKIVGVSGATASLASFRDPSWVDASSPSRVTTITNPGEIGFVTFKVKGPARRGTYTATFQLYANDQAVEGGLIDIPVTVTADGYFEPTPPITNDGSGLPNEPLIRVGVFPTIDDRMVVRASHAPVSVLLNGNAVCRLNIGQEAAVQYDRTTKIYTLSGGPCSSSSAGIFKFHADDDISPMTMADFSRPVWPSGNDNTFRRQLELMYHPAKDEVWTVNELPIEAYLKGTGETSNISPLEFQKALLTGARTYANYHLQRNTKHDGYFHVDSRYDQVYRGYGVEERSPSIVRAVDETRGQIVTYDGKLAITPYFSRSDGRTRSWGEVWYGGSNYPWLVGVPVPWDAAKNRTLWGHGVGMSATGALDAANEGWSYDRILKYFYTGIALTQIYR